MYAGATCGGAAYGGKSAASAADAALMLNPAATATRFKKFSPRLSQSPEELFQFTRAGDRA